MSGNEFPQIPTSAYLDPATGKLVAPEIAIVAEVPTVVPLPTAATMLEMSSAELTDELVRFGVRQPWPEFVTGAQKYLKRMTGITPGHPDYEVQMQKLIGPDSRRALVGMNRRIQERWTTLEALDGNAAQELIRVSEGDAASCDGCIALSGAIGTLEQHDAAGMPGSQECGDNCRCELMAID